MTAHEFLALSLDVRVELAMSESDGWLIERLPDGRFQTTTLDESGPDVVKKVAGGAAWLPRDACSIIQRAGNVAASRCGGIVSSFGVSCDAGRYHASATVQCDSGTVDVTGSGGGTHAAAFDALRSVMAP